MNRITPHVLAAVAAFCLIVAPRASAQHGWPIDPTGSEHPIGNTFGEFQNFGGIYQHTGIDILTTPKMNADGTENLTAPWVHATVGGTINSYSNSMGTAYNGATINATDGLTYRYWHLEYNSYAATFVTNFNNGTAAANNDQIAKIYRWSCDYSHNHYDIADATNYRSPMINMAPNPDPDPPEIDAIGFARDNSSPWAVMNPVAPGGCAVVDGLVDIIGKIRDRDNAGSTQTGAITLWVRNLRWRACPNSSPNCSWNDTHIYDDAPLSTGNGGNAFSTAAFSTAAPWISDSDYCNATWLYGVVTNFVGGAGNTAGNWNTNVLTNGAYTVSIEATDFVGNVTVRNARACVQNGGGCTTDLMLRDAIDDSGGIPYPGPVWWESPDITANPGTPSEDVNINVGTSNPIEVRVWNDGSCNIPSGTTYQVCLGWGPPSGSIAYPLPATQVIGCQTVTLAAAMPVGTSQTTTFNWAPTSGSVPLGHHCLIAWVDTAADPVLNTPAVNWDNNRAQQNIEFVLAPGPPAPSVGDFWVNPQRMIRDRSIVIDFSTANASIDRRDIRLLLPPDLVVERVFGGSIEVSATGDAHDPEVVLCDERCLTPEEAVRKRCYRVVRGIGTSGRLILDGIQVSKPQRLLLVVGPGGAIGQELTAHVVEYGTVEGQKAPGPVGGLTIRFTNRKK